MGKINLEFDTETKKLSVSVNGEAMPNVDGVYVYKYGRGDEYSIEITTYEQSEDKDMYKTTRVCASDGSLAEKNKDDFREYKTEDISKMLGFK